jgi:hypothetical protein
VSVKSEFTEKVIGRLKDKYGNDLKQATTPRNIPANSSSTIGQKNYEALRKTQKLTTPHTQRIDYDTLKRES